jgi:hypothetical protein
LHQVERAVNDYKAVVVKVNLADSVEELTSFLLQDWSIGTAMAFLCLAEAHFGETWLWRIVDQKYVCIGGTEELIVG